MPRYDMARDGFKDSPRDGTKTEDILPRVVNFQLPEGPESARNAEAPTKKRSNSIAVIAQMEINIRKFKSKLKRQRSFHANQAKESKEEAKRIEHIKTLRDRLKDKKQFDWPPGYVCIL